MSLFYGIGLDLGQRGDPAAIVVANDLEARPLAVRIQYQSAEKAGVAVRYAERIPLGTPYPVIVERVRRLTEHPELRGKCSIAMDATGLGGPVVDMMRAARIGCEVCAVTITSGNHETQVPGGYHVPKQDLLASVQVLLERGELHIAKHMREADSLMRELLSVKQRQSDSGRLKIGADGAGQHDDLVIALALACWRSRRRRNGPGGGRLPGM